VEAFSVTRWLTELRFPQVKHLPMQRIALVVPKDSGLPKSAVEAEQVKAFGTTEREVVEVPAAFASGNYDGWHFAGHGFAGRTGSSRVLLDMMMIIASPQGRSLGDFLAGTQVVEASI
jgi:hypothetical protein